MLEIAERVDGDNITLRLSGQLIFKDRMLFQAAITQAQTKSPKEIILNLAAVTYLDSTGLGHIIVAQRKLRDTQCRLSLVVSPGPVMSMFDIVNMEKNLPISVVEYSNLT